GTLLPPFLHGQFLFLFTSNNGLVTLAGILVALVGVAVVTYAGHAKKSSWASPQRSSTSRRG
ncbi:MAG: L-rhamnose/proton symporter RhaT, partial [Paludibaculum sp.]